MNSPDYSGFVQTIRRLHLGNAGLYYYLKAASTSEMNRFETEIVTTRKNLKSLMDVPGKWIDRVRQRRAFDKLILDPNSPVSETYGRQEGSA